MKLTAETAYPAIELVYAESGLKGIVCDTSGIIIAAIDKERIGTVHSGACRILREGLEETLVSPEEAARSSGLVRVGVNLPVIYGGKMVGTYGIGGDAVLVRPVARISVGLIRNALQEAESRRIIVEKEQRLQSLFSNMVEGVALHELILDADATPVNYRIIAVNDSYEKELGLKREDVCGKMATEAYETMNAPFLDKFSAVALTGAPDSMEVYFDPMGKHFLISVAPWGSEGFATIFTDISDRKRMEQELRLYADKLETTVEQRTQELVVANQELTAMNEEVFAMNESLGDANRTLSVEIGIRQQKELEVLKREKQYLATTGLLMRPAEDIYGLLESILRDAVQLVGAPGGLIALLDEDGKNFSYSHAFGINHEEHMAKQPVDQGMLGQVYRSGDVLCVEDYLNYPHRIASKAARRLSAAIMMPLKINGAITGVLVANWQDDVHSFTTEEIEVFRQFATLASIALERTYTDRQIGRQNQLLRKLAETTEFLVDELDLDKSLKNILKQATAFMGIPHGFVQLFDQEGNNAVFHCGSGRYESQVGKRMHAGEKGILAEILRTGKLVVIDDYAHWPDRLTGSLADEITTAMQAPLNIDGKTIGSFGLTLFGEKMVIDPAKIAVFAQFATIANIAVKNALSHQKTNHQAFHDSLTGLPNRSNLNMRLEEEIQKAQREKSAGAVMFVDIDDLKTVNDHFGHTCGDSVIVAAGQNIADAVGDRAFLARVGGDEFFVILPDEEDLANITRITERVSLAVQGEYEVGGQRIHMSASLGVARYPGDGNTAEELMKQADIAMYAAKSAGKNCWRLYEPGMLKDTYEKMVLTNSLRKALENGELFLHYQPLISLRGGGVVSFEALLRWNSPEHGMVSPLRFIPLAEQSGLILTIGQWVIGEACKFARDLADSGRQNVHVAVNVSSRQLAADDFVEMVRRSISETGIHSAQLEVEITESLLIESLEDGTRKLAELKALGIRLSLDDFGTGFSSLTYLRNLPVATLKIDKSFIDRILEDKVQEGFIRSIIDMSHVLGLNVVAEGVETQEQLSKLTQLGCDCVQGYVFSRPVSQENAMRFSL